MFRKEIPVVFFLLLIAGVMSAQPVIRTSDLFQREDPNNNLGQLVFNQQLSLDTLISRHILSNKIFFRIDDHYGMDGFRIQIYASNKRTAREEANKARAEFMSKFPDIVSYPLYAEPGYFKVRVGDFRTRTDATKMYQKISKEFDAYIVPDVINFPDLNIK